MKAWFKRNWKWIVFPVGLLLVLLVAAKWLMGIVPATPGTTTDEAADQAVDSIFDAVDNRGKALEDLEEKHEEKLRVLSNDQRKEYEEVKTQSLDEIAKWIDKL